MEIFEDVVCAAGKGYINLTFFLQNGILLRSLVICIVCDIRSDGTELCFE